MPPTRVTCPCCGMAFHKADFSGDNWEAFRCRVQAGINGDRLLGKLRGLHAMIDKRINYPGFDNATELRRFLKEIDIEIKIEIERVENFH